MDVTLTANLLPAALICKGFINGMPDCNYEIYLREVVNASEFFKKKSEGKDYTAPKEECCGEWDCISDCYSLDFKLIASETALRARNLFSSGIYKMAEGATAYCAPKIEASNPKYKPIQVTRIFAALRPLTLPELRDIRKTDSKQQGIDMDIKAILETLETQKHILMFFPYEFFTEIDHDFATVTSDIVSGLYQDFDNAFLYRKEVAPTFDTYFAFIYGGQFVLSTVEDGKLIMIDTVAEDLCPTYMKIKAYTEWA